MTTEAEKRARADGWQQGYFLTADELRQIQREAFDAAREQVPNLRRPVFGYGMSHEMIPKFHSFSDYLKTKEPKL